MMQRAMIIVLSLFATTFGSNDLFAEKLSQALSIPKADVQTCMNKTNVQIENAEKLEMMINNVHTPEIEESVTKVGCLFACIAQKKELMSGARLNINKIKEFLDSKYERQRLVSSVVLILQNRIIDMCGEQVQNEINECEVPIKFFLCMNRYGY